MTTALRSRALWAAGNWYRAGWYQSIVLRQRADTAVCILARYVRRAPRASRTNGHLDGMQPSRHRGGVASAEGFLTAASARGGLRARDRISLRNRRSRRRSFSSSTPWLPPLLTRPHPSCSPRERGPPFSLSISFRFSVYLSLSLFLSRGPLLRLAFLLPRLTRRTPRRGSYSCSDDDTG